MSQPQFVFADGSESETLTEALTDEDSVGRAADVEFCVWTLSYLQAVSGPLRARGEEQPKRQM